ncbi:DUF418 domain-containing protein [Nocardiopsis baichengensis]|uniref:DUF418 domain-containing protein n=1 Tax=Nocardiopsis baichengensis TaxID=280240 RepID=UPI000348A145|nr:DUF418 domain-containing protein [Nocardiopsis baichengensis]
MSTPSSPPPGAAPAARRSLAPDLARGFMLLIIATVHVHMFRIAIGGGAGYSLDGPLDTAATAVIALFAENRGYPMFAALFGYGLAQIHRRRTAEGREWPWVRRLLRRRGRWLVAIGLAHAVLIFFGDIIAVYGLIALAFAGVMRWTDRRLLAHALAWGSAGTLAYSAVNTAMMSAGAEAAQVTSPLEDLAARVFMLPFFLPLLIVISVFPFMAGVWAARRRLLDEPGRNRALLVRLAAIGIPAAVLGGVPHMLANIEVWQPSAPAATAVFWLHMLVGYAGGFGYAALIALIALRLGDRRGPVVSALAATGKRSMTCYLLQSVAWLVLMPAYTLDLAADLGDAEAVGIGAAVWLATVILADLMRRAGDKQGPAEWFLRRMTYGRPEREKVATPA